MRKILLVLFVLSFFFSTAIAQDDEMAQVRIIHLSADAGAVDLYVDGDLLIAEVEFGTATDWMEMDEGTYSVAVVPTEGDLEDAVLEAELEVEAGDWVTVAAIGQAGRDTLALQVLAEDYSPLEPFQARLSVFHAVPNYDPINVVVNDVELIRYLGYPGFWGPDSDGFISFDILAQPTSIRLEEQDGTVAVELEDIVVGGNRHYFLAISGVASDPDYVFIASDLEMMPEEDE